MQFNVYKTFSRQRNSNLYLQRRYFVTAKPEVTSSTISFVEELAKKVNIQKLDDWYEIDSKAINKSDYGQELVKQYGGLANLIIATHPNHTWKMWRFKTVPTGFWNEEKNQEKYMKWLGEQLNIKDQEGWYNVTWEDMVKHDGSYLLKKYSNSPPFVIMNTLKEYKWNVWKFNKIPKPMLAKLRTDLNIQKEFLNYLMKEEYLTSVDELLSITKQKLRKYASLTHKEYIDLVKTVYPQTSSSEYGLFRYKTQKILFNYIKVLFPDEEIRSNDRTTVKTQVGTPLELDIYLPVKHIAFEYQGEQHYSYVRKFGSRNLVEMQQKDASKYEACKRLGITLITIPYWWDLSIHSLISTIRKIRPDIALNDRDSSTKADPIPEANPKPNNKAEEHLEAIKKVEKSIMLGTYWDNDKSTIGWWMSEKYDGIRAYWDKTKLISRNGITINAPSWFLSSLPNDISLDGELWVKYGGYREAQTLAVSSSDKFWKDAKYLVFDVVDYAMPFEYRYNLLKNIKFSVPFIQYVEHTQCNSEQEFKNYFEKVRSHNGEGIMLTKPGSLYTPGRSNELRKYKGFLTTEVKVLRDSPNGLLCEQLNGETTVIAHPTMILDTTKLPIDSIVSVKYEGVNSAGQLHYSHRYPIFIKKRTDVDWQYLVYRYNEDNNNKVTAT